MAASAGATFADRGTEAGTKAEADERSARQATTRAICGEQQPKHTSSGKWVQHQGTFAHRLIDTLKIAARPSVLGSTKGR